MKLILDSDFVEWLSNWELQFDWDKGNLEKNLKHGLCYLDIERIFENAVYVAGRISDNLAENRWLLLGELKNKYWALIVTKRADKLRVISCRRQRSKELQFYEYIKEENQP